MQEIWNALIQTVQDFVQSHNTTASLVIVCFCAALVIAAVASVIQKKGVGRLVRSLLKSGAQSPETARTLREAGLADSVLLQFALRRGSMLHRTVSTAPCGEKTARCDRPLYIDPAQKERAEHLYRARGSAVGAILLALVGAAVLCVLLVWLYPVAIDLYSTVFAGFAAL